MGPWHHFLLTCPRRGTVAAEVGFALPPPAFRKQCAPPPPRPQGKFAKQHLAYKVLGCQASFEEGQTRCCRSRPARGEEQVSRCRGQPGWGTLRASRGAARAEQEARHRPAEPGVGTGRGRRCLVYPRPGEGRQQQVLPRRFHHPAGTCGFRACGARRRPASPHAPLCTARAAPRVLHGPRWAPRAGRSTPGALRGCLAGPPSSPPPRGRASLPVFCRDRRPFCWEPRS